MQPGRKHILALVFLSVFLFLRVGHAHAFVHWDHDAEITVCDFCDVIIQSQEITPLLDNDDNSELVPKPTVRIEKTGSFINYEAPLYVIVCPSFIYNKPPPSL